MANVCSELKGLVEAALKQAQRVQRHRNQGLRESRCLVRDTLAHQARQDPACCQLAIELERLHQAVNGEQVL
jgi:hypothetical protein